MPRVVKKRRAASNSKTSPFAFVSLSRLRNEITPRRRTPSRRAAARKLTPKPAPVDLLDETSESDEMLNAVEQKVTDFMKTGGFISSDEEEEPIALKKESSSVFVLDDSEDDVVVLPNKEVGYDDCKPGTSADADPTDLLKDLKSLEDYRKETEEMLKRADVLLDEFKRGPKEPEPKKLETSPTSAFSCAICLESLCQRPAASTVCGHLFCKECITQAVKSMKKCPSCRKPLNMKKIHPIYL